MIKEFSGEYAFLSNFHHAPFKDGAGRTYDTVEHFFQSHKVFPYDTPEFEAIRTAKTPGKSKRLGRHATLRTDWEDKKQMIMGLGLLLKFVQHSDLKQKLIETAPKELQEGNTWGDKYWGVDLLTGEGENILGKELMKIRGVFINGML